MSHAEDAVVENAEEKKKVYTTKKEILDRVKELAHGDGPLLKDELDDPKTAFYKLHIAEKKTPNIKNILMAAVTPDAYQIVPMKTKKNPFKAEMGIIKEKEPKSLQSRNLKRRQSEKKN